MAGYHAFISYSHSADGALAPALQRGLQQLGRPWRQRRAMEVFRDETGLAVDPDLWGAIVTALDASDWFVLLASPQAAASHWVGQEIEHCATTKGTERILIVLTEGTLRWDTSRADFTADSDAAHPALRGKLTAEPVIIDLSWARHETHLTLDNARFRADIARIAALIRGQPLATVVAHDARERRRTRTVLRSALGALTVATAVAVVAAVAAATSWRDATDEQAVAEDAARVALARELGARARIEQDPRAALTLAVEAYALTPEPELAGALLQAVSGVAADLVDLPPLLPAGYSPTDIRSSSGLVDGAGGRLVLATPTGAVVLDLASGQEWQLGLQDAYLTPDGAHVIGTDGTILAIGADGTVAPVAVIPSLGTEPSFTADGGLMAYRHDGAEGAQLIVAAATGEHIRSVPVRFGADCSGCVGDASWFAIAPDGSRVAARIGPHTSHTPVTADVLTFTITEDSLTPLASALVEGAGVVRFADDSATLWTSDGGTILVLDPASLEPAGEPMSIARSGPVRFADDARAVAVENCVPGVVLPPTMATIADLPAQIEFTEGGCVDAAGGEPRWLLGGSWVQTSAGAWPTEPEPLLAAACAAIQGTVSAAEFAELTGIEHAPLGCRAPGEES